MRTNGAFCGILGYTEGELLGTSFRDISYESSNEEEEKNVRRIVSGEIPSFTIEKRYVRKDGGIIWSGLTIFLIRNPDHSPAYFVGMIENITSRKEAENEIAASLREKETLLKEVHHRVKNNLQIISSLLNLQSRTSKDETTRAIFKDSQDRIMTMALIHEKLYQSGNFARVDFHAYLTSLVTFLFRSMPAHHVEYALDVEPIDLSIDSAIPCGLIVNELLTNTLKHAFPGGKSGTVLVGLNKQGDSRAVISVKDTGIGLPSDIDLHSTRSLGLHLVSILTEQIGGSIEIERGAGTTFRVSFPLN
jgi:PAS domain S-box-containing protein